jgi:hypothetical protein
MFRKRIYWLATMCLLAVTARAAMAGDKVGKNKTFVVNLTSPISTKDSKPGDTFTAVVIEPAEFQNSVVEGHVRKVEPAQNGEAPKAHISFAFETLTLPDNTTYKIQADLKDVTNSKGVAKVDEEGQVISQGNAGKRLGGAFGGAGLGSLAGGMLGGGMGSLIGGAVGGAVGYALTLEMTASSHNIEFNPGTHFTLEVSSKGVDKDVNADDVHKLEASNEAAMAAHVAVAADQQQPPTPSPAPDPIPQPAPASAPPSTPAPAPSPSPQQ